MGWRVSPQSWCLRVRVCACISVCMKPFNIKLTDEHRAKLEAYRAARGLRSEADAVRDLIDNATPMAVRQAEVRERVQATRDEIARGVRPGAARLNLEAKPAEPFKSRLKGQWKAP